MPSDRPQVRWRVDPDTKRAFERYVDGLGETGQGRYGQHLEKAMDRYVQRDPFTDLLEQLHAVADSLGVEKVKGKRIPMMDGQYDVPEGKNPGDVRRRQEAIEGYLLDLADDDRLPNDDLGHFATRKTIEDACRKVADISSPKTLTRYVKDITKRGPFRPHPERNGVWVVEP